MGVFGSSSLDRLTIYMKTIALFSSTRVSDRWAQLCLLVRLVAVL